MILSYTSKEETICISFCEYNKVNFSTEAIFSVKNDKKVDDIYNKIVKWLEYCTTLDYFEHKKEQKIFVNTEDIYFLFNNIKHYSNLYYF